MTPNAYLCAHCDHHENVHGRNYCRVMNGCDCTGFTPGNCPTCVGFGCADCFQDAKGRPG